MCRTVHHVIAAVLCTIQMMVRVFMTAVLMCENISRMILQTFYNFMSFLLQLISLIPICCVFLLTSRLKCFMCGGGGPCPVNRGGACDCLMSLLAIVILFVIFRATGLLDKIFYGIGYVKATPKIVRFSPTPGELTECSRNDTDTEYVFYKVEESTLELYDYITSLETTPSYDELPTKKFLRNQNSSAEDYYDEETTVMSSSPPPTTLSPPAPPDQTAGFDTLESVPITDDT